MHNVGRKLLVLVLIVAGATTTQAPLAVAARASLHYPPAPHSNAADDYFGTIIADPYRPLEAIDAPATKAWVARENRLTRAYLDAIPARPMIARAFRKLYNYPKMSAPQRHGSRYFYTYNTGLQTQSVIYVRDSESAPARLFFDPNTLSADGSVQLTGTSYTRDGSFMAYATSTGGEDWQTWHVKNVATRHARCHSLVEVFRCRLGRRSRLLLLGL